MKTLCNPRRTIAGILRFAVRAACWAGASRQHHGRSVALMLPVIVLASLQYVVARPEAPSGEVVYEWNQQLIDTVRAGLQPPTNRVERSYAMLHIAIFDAVNSIEKRYTPFGFHVQSSAGASAEAAAAQAGHDILAGLYPTRAAVYDAALAATLAKIPPGRARQGTRVGAAIAALVLAWRSDDRWNAIPPLYPASDVPGEWRPTPPGFSAATFTHYPDVVPFAIESPAQFLAPPPPALESADYTAAFNEVKAIGSATNQLRTAQQTQLARLHASVGTFATPNTVWNGIARDVSRAQGLGLVETARLFALLNVVFHDALQVSFTGKYFYGLWRPVTAIRNAGDDFNADTTQEDNWTPLLNAPPYPSYPGNAAALSAASARALALALKTDDVEFNVVFEGNGMPNVTNSYSGFWEAAEEQAQSRVWGGIHFSFESVASQQSSFALVDWVYARFMRPR
ncbi:MAG TPA: vanadium-dependent haloperoxidase [Clostridia bacterium]|nr:vanadium-dependent haloperoxidase [Clostridia bacterium]